MQDIIRAEKYIIGLGNPGEKYSNTRHNIGFMIIEETVKKLNGRNSGSCNSTDWTKLDNMQFAVLDNNCFIKPLTYMNLSGDVFSHLPEEIDPAGILVIVDDIYLPLGRLRFKAAGSAGGHNGLCSIETSLANTAYNRLKAGICNSTYREGELIDFVLQEFSQEESAALKNIISTAAEAVLTWLDDGLSIAQQNYNGIDFNRF